MKDNMQFDSWLKHYYDDYLTKKDKLCSDKKNKLNEIFSDLDDHDLWVLLLSKRYKSYPNIRRRLPGYPSADIQKKYNGGAGFEIIKRARVSYEKITNIYNKYSSSNLNRGTKILDFGVGWGRIIRFFKKDIPKTNLFGCDVSEYILGESKRIGLDINLKQSEPIPTSLPFDEKFDLVYSNSVFSHLSEDALNACFKSIAHSMRKGGIFIFTTWSPNYAMNSKKMKPIGLADTWDDSKSLFKFIPQKEGMSFGATFISLPYMQKNWNNDLFEFKEVALQNFGLNQVMCVLQRK